MIIRVAFVLTLIASSAHAQHPAGYWDKSYPNYDAQRYEANYNLTIKVRSLTKAMADAERRITKKGGSLLSLNTNYNAAALSNRVRTLSYSVNSATAEDTAKDLFSLGELQSYSATKANPNDLDEIRAKLKELTAERDSSAQCLTKMPISSYFIDSRINQLNQALASAESSRAKAAITLILTEPAESANR